MKGIYKTFVNWTNSVDKQFHQGQGKGLIVLLNSSGLVIYVPNIRNNDTKVIFMEVDPIGSKTVVVLVILK